LSKRPQLPDFQPHPLQDRAALAGIRVIDFTRVLAGPFASQLLGDLGAEIIKIEDPAKGDDTRSSVPRPSLGGESFFYLSLNRNKKSVALDLKADEGRRIARELIATADVVIENFTTPVMKRFGLDYASLKDAYPKLIYCSVSAYGRTGRLANAGGFDSVIAAEAGVQSLNAFAGEHPVLGAVPYTDITTAMNATIAVLAALQARHRYGEGQHLDIAMYDTALANLTFKGYEFLVSGNEPALSDRQSPIPRGEFDTADGAICITCPGDKMFRAFCGAVDHPEWLDDPRFATMPARSANSEIFLNVLQELFASQTSIYWSDRLKAVAVPCGVVRSPGEALLSRESAERGLVYNLDHPTAGKVPAIASPVRLTGTPGPVPSASPLLGQHTTTVLSELLGYDEATIGELAASGVIGRAPARADKAIG
jgi:crotonobetainyl-CoA:carnitine CoA-transferase CaiB-like acyl-CoA transferase